MSMNGGAISVGYAGLSAAMFLCIACGDNRVTPPDAADANDTSCEFDSSATPVRLGAITALTAPSAALNIWNDQPALVEHIVNAGCGIGDERTGGPLKVELVDGNNDAATIATRIDELYANQVRMIVGSGVSAIQVDGWNRMIANGHSVLYSGLTCAATNCSGCTQAQLDDPAITKQTTPVVPPDPTKCWDSGGIVWSELTSSPQWGTTLGSYVRQLLPTASAAVFRKNDPVSLSIVNSAAAQFVALGGTVSATVNHQGGATAADMKALVPTLVAGDPEVVMWSLPNDPEIISFMTAWYELSQDATFTKPAHFDTARLVIGSPLAVSIFSSASTAVRNYWTGRIDSFSQTWDPDAERFKAWYKVWTDYYPEKTDPQALQRMGSFDGLFAYALTVQAVGPDATLQQIVAKFYAIVNGPGTVYHADQYAEARAALLRGEAIDYEGALISRVDAKSGRPIGTHWLATRMDASGAFPRVKVYTNEELGL